MLVILSNLLKMIIFIFVIIIIVVLCVIIYFYLYKDEFFVSKYYINYMVILENDGVFIWFLDFFLYVVVDILIYINVEDDYFFFIFF